MCAIRTRRHRRKRHRVQGGGDVVQGAAEKSKRGCERDGEHRSAPLKPLSMAEAIKSMNLPPPSRSRATSSSSQYAPLYRSPLAAVRARYEQQAENLRSAINARVAAATPAKMKVSAHGKFGTDLSDVPGDARNTTISGVGMAVMSPLGVGVGVDMEALD